VLMRISLFVMIYIRRWLHGLVTRYALEQREIE
jgi:hypothetical protein